MDFISQLIEPDPYHILELPYSASEEDIQKAFQAKMLDSSINKETLVAAYGKIRDRTGRSRFLWEDFRSCLFVQKKPKAAAIKIDVEGLAKELSFANTWELGDDSCLN